MNCNLPIFFLFFSTVFDACASNPCESPRLCSFTASGYSCDCPAGLTGETCETGMRNVKQVWETCETYMRNLWNMYEKLKSSNHRVFFENRWIGVWDGVSAARAPLSWAKLFNINLVSYHLNYLKYPFLYTCHLLSYFPKILQKLTICMILLKMLLKEINFKILALLTSPCIYFSDVNECARNPCENNGICQNEIGSFTCQCMQGYVGTMCESKWYLATE